MAPQKMLAMAIVMLALVAMLPNSMSSPHLNDIASRPFGLITTSSTAANELLNSEFFQKNEEIELSGRTFITGRIHDFPVVFIKGVPSPSINAALDVQLMAHNFVLRGFIHFGSVGATNETLKIGDVVVPTFIYFTGALEWLSKDSNTEGQLVIGNFNYPNQGENGNNLLGSIKYNEMYIYDQTYKLIAESYHVDPYLRWLNAAAAMKVDSVKVVINVNASSSDILVYNPAYREFIYKEFGLSTVDTTSAGVGLGAKSSGFAFISIGGVSNYAGAGDGEQDSALAAKNVVKAVAAFIKQMTSPDVQIM